MWKMLVFAAVILGAASSLLSGWTCDEGHVAQLLHAQNAMVILIFYKLVLA